MTHSPFIRVLGPAGAALLLIASASGCSTTSASNGTTGAVTTSSAATAVGMQLLDRAYRGLPVRLKVTGPAHARVRIIQGTPSGRRLVAGRLDGTGATTLTWTWKYPGKKRVTARIGSKSVARTMRVHSRRPPVTPPTSTTPVWGVFTAAGQQQYLDCAGTGGPTVVLISGQWGTAENWNSQVTDARRGGRVCRYDRPGLGGSPGRTGSLSVDSALHATELLALLNAAGERGPYEIVGHSYGGLIAQSFAALYPRKTAGMVLLDPVPIGFSATWPSFGPTLDEATPRTTIDLGSSNASGRAGRPLVGMPLILVSAGAAPSWLSDTGFQAWRESQAAQVAGCANCLHWIAAGATHQLQDTAPELTTTAIETVRMAWRTHRPLKT